jgi:5S rRNA maturation endonuclease (ribonuclease M5)
MGKRELARIIEDIKENACDSVILVEGKRDEYALEKLGIPYSSIIKVSYKNNNQIYEDVIRYGRNKIIALYDNDRTGKNKFSMLKSFFEGMGIKILDYKTALEKAGITYIEEIDNRLGC